MALLFSASSTHLVSFGTSVPLDQSHTAMFWAYRTSTSQGRYPYARGTTRPALLVYDGSGNLRAIWAANTTALSYITNDTPIATTNKWYFIAVAFDFAGAGANAAIYVGDLSTPCTESTYGTSIDGVNPKTSTSLYVGNRSGGGTNWQGGIANFHWNSNTLTLAQIREQQFRPHVIAGTEIFCELGYNGVGTQPDWSGNGNSGAVTGATVVDHVPKIMPFGCDRLWTPAAAAAAGGLGIPLAAHHYKTMAGAA